MSIRDRVKAAKADRHGLVDREVLGEKVKLRQQVSAGELLSLAAAPAEKRPALQVAMCLHDEQGKPLFASADEVAALAWPEFDAFLKLTREVKGLDLEGAAKK
jgi:hypothetical protein